MNHSEIAALMKALAPVIREYTEDAIKPLVARFDALEKSVAETIDKSAAASAALDAQVTALASNLTALSSELEDTRKAIPEPVELPDFAAMLAAGGEEWVERAVAALPTPQDGKDADPEVIAAEVAKAVAALPAAKDGKDADPEQVAALVARSVADAMPTDDMVAALVGDAVEKAVSALPVPKDGKDADLDAIAEQVAAEVAKSVQPAVKDAVQEAVAAIPPVELPSDEHLATLIAPVVAKTVADLPPAKDGTSVTVDDVAPIIASEVEKAVAAIPVPQNGRDGLDLKDLFRAEGGRLVAVMSDGTTRDLGVFVGKDGEAGQAGKDGVNGTDGVGFDDLDLVVADDGVAIVFARGDDKKAFPLPVPYDRGVYRPEAEYRKGNGVTWGGQFWIAQKDAPEGKPGDGEGWRLSVKKGRDSRPAPVKSEV